MADPTTQSGTLRRPVPGAELLTLGDLAAAFGLASCCVLPLLLSTLGLGAAWLTGVAVVASPHRDVLLGIGAACLFGGAVLLWRQQRAAAACTADGACTPSWVRAVTLVGLLHGVGLLCAGYVYA